MTLDFVPIHLPNFMSVSKPLRGFLWGYAGLLLIVAARILLACRRCVARLGGLT
jgi:hypothetical protein